MQSISAGFETLINEMKTNKPDNLTDETEEYRCDTCKDTGYYNVDEYSKEYEGYIRVTKECKCLGRIQSEEYLKRSGMNELMKFRVNDYKVEKPYQKAIKQKATDYITSDSRDWFVMLGQSGVGKTHICSAIAKTLIDKGLRAKYITWDDFTEAINKERYEDGNLRALNEYQTLPLLYIDDFFKGRITENDLTIAYRVLNFRYNNGLTTIISSEYTLNEMAKIDSAIAGRIKQHAKGYLIEIEKDNDKNYRMQKDYDDGIMRL